MTTTPTEATKAVARAILREMNPRTSDVWLEGTEAHQNAEWSVALRLALAAEKARPDLPVVTVPEGWRLVPVEPTQHMLHRLNDAVEAGDKGWWQRAYAAMLAAAPPPPTLAPVALPGERLAELEVVIESAAAWFEDYARQHHAKNPPDIAKAATNEARARTLRQAIQKGASDGE